MPEKLLLAVLLAASMAGFCWRVVPILRRILATKTDADFSLRPLSPRVRELVWEVLLQAKVIRQRPLPGLAHAFVFWGFCAFALVTLNHLAIGFGAGILSRDSFYFPVAAVFAVLVMLAVVGWYLINSNSSRERAASAPPPSPSAAAPAPSPAPTEPARAPQTEAAAPATAAATPSSAPESVAPPTPAPPAPEHTVPERPAATTTKATVTALTAEVCSSLTRTGAWSCAPASGAQAPGVMYFYTRVASPRDTTIEHRWYRGDTLVQRVPLRIRANPSGFRTYSQNRISAERTGTWKVELRTQDGQLLDEKTFAIR